MENNELTRQIEKQANEKLKNMSNDEIKAIADKEKNSEKKKAFGSAIICAIGAIFLLSVLLIFRKTISFMIIPLIVVIVIMVGVGIWFLIYLKKKLSKSNDDWALKGIIKELKRDGIMFSSQDDKHEYQVSKTIDILDEGTQKTRLLFDNDHKVFQLQIGEHLSKLFKFSDIINYEVYENGASKVSGTAGQALIGGAFFGLGGMIIGSSMGRTVQDTCSQLKLIIRLNDMNCPQMQLVYISSCTCSKDSTVYRTKRANLQLVCSQLEYMINSKTLEESAKIEQPKATVINDDIKQQILTLQEMCKDGLITEEEFEQKKKQILGL